MQHRHHSGRPSRRGLIAAAVVSTLLTGCFSSSRDLVQRDLEPIGDDDDTIAVIAIHNEIVEHHGDGAFHGSDVDGDEIALRLRAAGRDTHVKAVVLDLDTGGGDVTATDMIYHQVLAVREAGKPVIAVMGSVCASGGYYIATAADTIITAPSTITGSIGVIFESPDLHGFVTGHLGIDVTVIKSGALKDIGSPMRAMTDEEKKIIQGMVDQSYEQFLGVVADRRKGHGPLPLDRQAALERIRTIADGRVITGTQAIQAGLADQTGFLFDAIAVASRAAHITDTPKVIRYGRDNGIFGISAASQETHINAGVELNANILPLAQHARLEYRWASW